MMPNPCGSCPPPPPTHPPTHPCTPLFPNHSCKHKGLAHPQTWTTAESCPLAFVLRKARSKPLNNHSPALDSDRDALRAGDGDPTSLDLVTTAGDPRPVVICGFGELGQTVANMIESPLAISMENRQMPYIAFDLSPDRIRNARAAGFNVMYGNPTHLVSA